MGLLGIVVWIGYCIILEVFMYVVDYVYFIFCSIVWVIICVSFFEE